jgi:hypothetical protein
MLAERLSGAFPGARRDHVHILSVDPVQVSCLKLEISFRTRGSEGVL